MADKESGGGGGGGKGGFLKAVIILLILFSLLMTGLFVASRTDAGRNFAQEWVKKCTGKEVTVKQAKLMPPFVLVLDDVATTELAPGGEPLFKAQEIRYAPKLNGGWNLAVERGVLNMVRSGENMWNPSAFSRLGDVPFRKLGEVSSVVNKYGRYAVVHVSDCTINWMRSNGVMDVSVTGIIFDSAPFHALDRKMRYYKLSVYSMSGPDGFEVKDVEREWISSDARNYIEVKSGGKAEGSETSDFWAVE